MNAWKRAVSTLTVMHEDSSGRWLGASLRDAYFPVIEVFDGERDISCVVIFFDDERERAELEVTARARTCYRNYDCACGVVPVLVGLDRKWEELDWSPNEDDEAAYKAASDRHYEEMRMSLEAGL